MKIKEFKKRLFIIGAIIVLAIALPLTVYLVQQQQNLQQGAAGQRYIKFVIEDPKNYNVGDKVKVDILLHPNGKATKAVNLIVNYDQAVLSIAQGDFSKNTAFTLDPQAITFNSGNIALNFNTGDSSKFVSSQVIIGTLTFTVTTKPDSGSTQLFFGPGTRVKDGSGNEITDYTFNPQNILIGAAACIPDVSTCSWSPVDGAAKYHYIIQKHEFDVFTPIKEGDTTDTSVSFSSEPGMTYTCTVSAANGCGTGTSGVDEKTCTTPSPTITLTPTITPTGSLTPTLTPTVTITPTGSLTPTLTPTITPTLTLTPTATLTPTGTLTPTLTPTPTTFVATGTPTPTETLTPTETPVPGVSATSTPRPTLPPTGSSVVTFGAILGAGLVILGGLLLLIF